MRHLDASRSFARLVVWETATASIEVQLLLIKRCSILHVLHETIASDRAFESLPAPNDDNDCWSKLATHS